MSDFKCLFSILKGKKELERYIVVWEYGRMVRRIMVLLIVVIDFRIMYKSYDFVGFYIILFICVKLVMFVV